MRTAIVYNFLIEANLMASIAILLMVILRCFLRRQLGNTALCFGWLLVAVRLLLPISLPNPLISAIRPAYLADQAIRPIAGQVKVRLTDALSDAGFRLWMDHHIDAGNRLVTLSNEIENASAPILLVRIYLLGMAAVLLWYAVSNLRFRMKLRADRIEPISGDLLAQYQALCAARGVRPVPVYFVDPLPSACLVGVFRPYIALPLTASPQHVIHVLTHEVCHVKNGDHYWSVLRLACCALHWFNPLVWLAADMSRTDSELRCDDRVVGPMDQAERQDYAGVLVLAAARRSAPGVTVLATGMTMTGKRLKTRVLTVLQQKRALRWLSLSFMALASLCLVGAFATAEMRVVPRLLRSHPAISRVTLTSEEDAIRYAQTVLELQKADSGLAGLNWQVENAADDPDECYVYAQNTQGELVFDMTTDRAGNVKSFWLADDHRWNDCAVTLSEREMNDLADDLQRFIGEINPEVAKKCIVCAFDNERRADDSRAIDAFFWPSDAARENNYDVAAYCSVQIAPQTRVMVYNIFYGDMNGNG